MNKYIFSIYFDSKKSYSPLYTNRLNCILHIFLGCLTDNFEKKMKIFKKLYEFEQVLIFFNSFEIFPIGTPLKLKEIYFHWLEHLKLLKHGFYLETVLL